MQQVRDRLAKFTDLRTSVRNLPSFNIGGGNWDIDFVLRGPDLEALAAYAERTPRPLAKSLASSTPIRR